MKTSSHEYTVLFVDDEPAILRALTRTLKHPKCRFVTTSDPTKVIDLIREERADVLFSDVDMPQMSGLDLVRKVRAAAPQVVRMMLTGGRSLATALSAINEGGVLRFMLKPWDDDLIRHALAEALLAVDEIRAGGASRAVAAARDATMASLDRRFPGIVNVGPPGAHRLDYQRLVALSEKIAPGLVDRVTRQPESIVTPSSTGRDIDLSIPLPRPSRLPGPT